MGELAGADDAGEVAAEEIPADEQAPEVGSEQAAEVAAENSDAEFPGSRAPLESGEAPEGYGTEFREEDLSLTR